MLSTSYGKILVVTFLVVMLLESTLNTSFIYTFGLLFLYVLIGIYEELRKLNNKYKG